MDKILLGFFTGLSLILALGPQNLFVIEQGLKKNYIFTVCLICTMSDVLFIFLGIFLFTYFTTSDQQINNLLTILLIIFIANFILGKVKAFSIKYETKNNNTKESFRVVILKTLAFTYLNPHVYSDTIFILGNLSKNYDLESKFYFAFGASISSVVFFYCLGYMSSMFGNFIKSKGTWKYINIFIIFFMFFLVIYIIYSTYLKLLSI